MVVVAYNLRAGGRVGQRVHWQRALTAFKPDLMLVQETLAPDAYLPPEVCSTHARRMVWAPVPGRRWGSAILSTSGRLRSIAVPGFEGQVVGAEVTATPWTRHTGRPLRVFSVHIPAPYKRPMQLFLDYLATLPDTHDLVLGGDFNLATGVRHAAEPLPSDPPWMLERLRKEFNLLSCWQTVHPNRDLAQTLRWSGNPAAPYHCDGIFVPASWFRYLDDCQVIAGPEWNVLSDHNPVTATFAERPARPTARRRGSARTDRA